MLATLLAAVLVATPPLQPPKADTGACRPSAMLERALMAMSPDDFDQTSGGWRPYAERGCYATAARLIGGYLAIGSRPTFQAKATLLWHHGQMLASAGRYGPAVKAFEISRSIRLRRDEAHQVFAEGEIAFLHRNRASLDHAIVALKRLGDKRRGADGAGALLNANALEGLRRCFTRPYWRASAAPCIDLDEARRLNRLIWPEGTPVSRPPHRS